MKTLPKKLVGVGLVAVVLTIGFALGSGVGAQVQGGKADLSAVDFQYATGALWFFDRESGDLWVYDEERRLPLWHFKVSELGAPLEQIQLEQTRPADSPAQAEQ